MTELQFQNCCIDAHETSLARLDAGTGMLDSRLVHQDVVKRAFWLGIDAEILLETTYAFEAEAVEPSFEANPTGN
jgi:hypothetical protein